jgi:hypothetical protein
MMKLAQTFAVLSSLAAIGFVSTGALADKIKDAGSIDAAYVKRDAQPIADGKPNTAFNGTYTIAADEGTLGIKGEGTYSGYFTAENKFHVDWKGTRSAQKDAMVSPNKN